MTRREKDAIAEKFDRAIGIVRRYAPPDTLPLHLPPPDPTHRIDELLERLSKH